jgi:hypothetical protein
VLFIPSLDIRWSGRNCGQPLIRENGGDYKRGKPKQILLIMLLLFIEHNIVKKIKIIIKF